MIGAIGLMRGNAFGAHRFVEKALPWNCARIFSKKKFAAKAGGNRSTK
jgi:hypothetical protein